MMPGAQDTASGFFTIWELWIAMSGEDVDYFERRAEAEIALAQKARNTEAVQAHYQMATLYLDRIYGSGEEKDQ